MKLVLRFLTALVAACAPALSGAKMTHVPYKGTTQATLDVISGHIPVMFSATSLVIEQMQKIIKGAGLVIQ